MNGLFRNSILVLWIISLGLATAQGEEIRDYYAEPGLNPFKQTLQDLNESIDPFSGTLQHKHVDLLLPGNGGMDIAVNRVYTSLQDGSPPGTNNVNGLGWTLHFGRITVPTAHVDKVCTQGADLLNEKTADNPSIEFPDGGRELLVLHDASPGYVLVTKSNWKVECLSNSAGFRATAPNGMTYSMDVQQVYTDGAQTPTLYYSWYTSRIEDLDGNWIDIEYAPPTPTGLKRIKMITTSDNREVVFSYVDATGAVVGDDSSGNTPPIQLASISANGQTVQYEYQPLGNVLGGTVQLSRVIRPDGLSWQYEYNGNLPPDQPEAGRYSLSRVTYPHGGQISYSYQRVQFAVNGIETTAIKTKRLEATQDVTPGDWVYEFIPAAGSGVLDKTIVHTPVSRVEYEHYGYFNSGVDVIWKIGLLTSQRTFTPDGVVPVEEILNTWGKVKISEENYWHGRDVLRIDNAVYRPVLISAFHARYGRGWSTTYSGHDGFGNPDTVVEECAVSGCSNRVTHRVYQNDTSQWIIGQLGSETVETIGTVQNDYFPNGRLQRSVNYGVETQFTYTPEGDLETQTNARGFVTTYTDYHRGIARQEVRQVDAGRSITVRRMVNDTGTVASQTDGRGYSTHFSYDPLNRLASISYPVGQGVSIQYGLRSQVLTRGDYEERSILNGTGQVLRFERRDKSSGETITTSTHYDALGRSVFESYPGSTLGTTTDYDALGSVIRTTHGDGSFRTMEYGSFLPLQDGGFGAFSRLTDEEGKVSYILDYFLGSAVQSLGPYLIRNDDNATNIEYHQNGMVKQWVQGVVELDSLSMNQAVFRDYFYDEHWFLISMDNPETGLTVYGRDEVGNKTSSQVGASPITHYSYDGLDRLTLIDYPEQTPDVSMLYDDSNNIVQISKGVSSWSYDYDENDNLLAETLSLSDEGPAEFRLQYQYNGQDIVQQVTYPGGVVVDFAPNAFGRSTRAGEYARNVSYHPSGPLAAYTLGNGVSTQIALNNRQLIESIQSDTALGDAVVDLAYQYDGASNVSSINDGVRPALNVSMAYDAIDRLTSTQGPWGTETLRYSPQGDILDQVVDSGNTEFHFAYDGLQRLAYAEPDITDVQIPEGVDPATYLASLRVHFNHDEYGNLLNNFSNEFAYDHASNLVEAGVNLGTAPDQSYAYDGHNQRFRTLNHTNNRKTLSVYNQAGHLMVEQDWLDCLEHSYIYLGGSLIARDTQDLSACSGNSAPMVPVTANGDINGDGQVNTGDLLLATQHNAGLINLSPEQIARGDLYPAIGDGALNASDILILQQIVAGITADGDVNGDGDINPGDLLLAYRHTMGIGLLTLEKILRGDVFADGALNTQDIVLIQKIILEVQ